jgi:hypothetical protein
VPNSQFDLFVMGDPTLWATSFTPNEFGYQSRDLPGLDSRYFVAQQSPDRFDVIESARGSTRAIINRGQNGWTLLVEGTVQQLGTGRNATFVSFFPVDESFDTPQAAVLAFNDAIFAWEHPARVTQKQYLRFHGTLEVHRAAVATEVFYKRPVAPEILADYPDLAPWQAEDRSFNSELFDRREKDIEAAIKDSRARGFQHLDQLPFYVETMRGVHFHSIRDGSSGTATTVGSDGLIRVRWDDAASAEKNCGSLGEDYLVSRRDAAEFIVDGRRKVTLDRKRSRYVVEGAQEPPEMSH